MKLIDTSVKRPIGVIMIVIAVMLIGAIALTNLSIDLYPELEVPFTIVVTEYDDAAPEEVENLVTRMVEMTLSGIEGIKTLQSVSATGQSLVVLEFDWGTSLDAKVSDIRSKLDRIVNFLPDGAGKPIVINIDPNALPIMRLSISGDIDSGVLTNLAHEVVKPRLDRAVGVSGVTLIGTKEREISVELSPVYLEGYGISVNQIIQTLAMENMSVTAGTLLKGNQALSLMINGDLKSVEDIKNVIIQSPRGSSFKLSELANVYEKSLDVREITKVNGVQSLVFDISKKADANTLSVANEVYAAMADAQQLLPKGTEIGIVYDLSIFIREAVNNVVLNLLVGAILAGLVLYLFLRSFRTTLIIAITIPIAVIATFTLIYFSKETLNLLTLGGLALGIGMMVDSSIVILENIFRYNEEGHSRVEAAKRGADEVASAVIASALTTVAVFVPIVFVQGIASEIFTPMATTISFALIISLLAALTLVPMLAAYMQKVQRKPSIQETATEVLTLNEVLPTSDATDQATEDKPKRRWQPFKRIDAFFGKIYTGYRKALAWSLSHRLIVVVTTVVLLAGSVLLVPLVGTEFLPEMDQGEINIDVRLPDGTILDETEEVIALIVEELERIPEVGTIFSSAGSGGSFAMGGTASNIGNIYAEIGSVSDRDRSTNEIMDQIRTYTDRLPGATIEVTQMDSGGMFSSGAITVKVIGNDLNVLGGLTEELKSQLERVEGTRNVKSSLERARPQLEIVIDREKAAAYGLSYNEVMNTVRTGFNGSIATRILHEGREVNVRVILPEEYRADMSQINELPIMLRTGVAIKLREVAELKQTTGFTRISHEDQKRLESVTAEIFGRDLGSVTEDVKRIMDGIKVPDGYQLKIGGEAEEMAKAFDSLKFALIISVFLVYMVMAVQFEALTHPFVIMFSIPAIFIGIMLGLAITGRTLNVATYIGIIMLVGIVVNNAIVLVDYINILRRRGRTREEAILIAGPNRLRPILMTTLTTVLALIPLTLGFGSGAELQAPFATVIVFGLSFSTVVTLLLVPVVYTYMDDLERLIRRKFLKTVPTVDN